MKRSVPALLVSGSLLLAPACVSADPQGEPATLAELEHRDEIVRLHKALESQPEEDPMLVMNRLERLMLSWERQQRADEEEPLEVVLTATVVKNFDAIVDILHTGAHERRVVAAWALGFSRIPENELGMVSRHEDAVRALVGVLDDAPDDILQNVMIALWNLGEPTTPLQPILDVVVNHHDALARANATLALVAILSDDTAGAAEGAVLVALEDKDPKVRLHAASVAKRFPSPAYTKQIQQLLLTEKEALVRANMALALGASGNKASARYLVPLLSSPRRDGEDAHRALIAIFGKDLGPSADDWKSVVP